MPIKTYKFFLTIVLYYVIKRNLEKSFENGPEHSTTSLNSLLSFIIHTEYENFRKSCHLKLLILGTFTLQQRAVD